MATVASESGQATSTVAEFVNEFDATALTSPPEIDAASNTSVSGFEEVPASNTSVSGLSGFEVFLASNTPVSGLSAFDLVLPED